MRRVFALLSLLCLGAAVCPGDDSAAQPKVAIPESSFISPHQYTNAFFGFSLSIPAGCHFQIFDQSESDKPLEHFLFGEKCPEKGLTSFGITATPLLGNADDAAQKAVLLPRIGPRAMPEALSFGGRLFWKNALEEKTLWGQKVWRAHYATVSRGFVLLFWMSSYTPKLAADLRQAFESIQFFDPSRAQQMADANSQPYVPEAARLRIESTPGVNIAELDGGKLRGNFYVNSSLGFSYQFPEDWVRSALSHLQPAAQASDAAASFSGSAATATDDHCVHILTSFTRYDEHNRGLDFNPRVTILAANPSCFIPDMKFPKSLEDNETVKSYGEALVHSLVGTRLIGRATIKLFGIDLNDHIFVEITSSNAESVAGSTLLRKIHTDMILTTIRNAWIIWLLESDDEADFGTVLKSSISFASVPRDGR
jgi:hypothetical protein